MSDPLAGAVLDGRYRIDRALGEGGMGVVYLGLHLLLRKRVAIKVLRSPRDEEAKKRFLQEARAASMIEHSNVIGITDFGFAQDGRAYLVMELLSGRPLSQVIQQGPLQSRRVVWIGSQIARALWAIHDQGVIHRDLKPDNIFLLDREGQTDIVKIVDFGIARIDAEQRLTAEGMVVGTADYMAPEQACGLDIDARSDQYALGCTLYEMLTGTLPFVAKGMAAVMHQHVYSQVVPPRQRRPDLAIPAALEEVVLRALAKEPKDRFADLRQLEQALQLSVEPVSGPLREPTAVSVMRTRQVAERPRMRTGRMPLLLGLGLACIALSTTLVVHRRNQGPERAAVPSPVVPSPVAVVSTPPTTPVARPVSEIEKKHTHGHRHGPLQVSFVIIQPPEAEVTISCRPNIRASCLRNCRLMVPEGSQCTANALGFDLKVLKYKDLVQGESDGQGTVKYALSLSPTKL